MNLVRRIGGNIGRLTGSVPKRSAMGSTPFDAAGHGRRALGLNSTQLGLNTLLYSYGLELLQRNRDAVRNSGWAAGAIDSYVGNAIGKGVRMVPEHPDPTIQELITQKWNRWTRECDLEFEKKNSASGQMDFYGYQMLAAREIMEAGEVFVRFITRPLSEGLTVPLQLQLLESEQLPIWRMDMQNTPDENRVRFGIEYRPDNRREAYHFWKAHPGETMFFPQDVLKIERIKATEVLHVYKQVRAGQMRGMPWLTPVLAKLFSLDKYFDSEIFRKEVSSMITGFITQVTPNEPVFTQSDDAPPPKDPTVQLSKLEPGTFPVLNQGETVEFADVKDSGDFAAFIRAGLQAFASGAGMMEYQISGDLSKISYSSIRAGLLEFRRKCEQYQHAVFIHQFCHPIYRRWLKDAMLSLAFGAKLMNDYAKDPEPFEQVQWVTPGWAWVDPDKEIKAFERAVRDGFTSRSQVCAQQGVDSSYIDRQQKVDNARADDWKLSYDSDGRKVLTGRNAGLTEEDITDETEEQDQQEEVKP